MVKTIILLLFASTLSFSLYLTPTPVSRRSVGHFFQFFFLITALFVGLLMTVPYVKDWKLPMQQGLGSNLDLVLRGLLISAACLFSIVVTKTRSEGSLPWIKAILLLLVGIPGFTNLWAFLDTSVNDMLNASQMSFKQLYAFIYPYFIVLAANLILISVGSIQLISNVYKTYRDK